MVITQMTCAKRKQLENRLRIRQLNHLMKDLSAEVERRQKETRLVQKVITWSNDITASKKKKNKRPAKQRVLMNTPISFPSIMTDDASDEPLIIEAEVEGYLVRRVYVDEGSSAEVMFEHCFENLPGKGEAELRETELNLVVSALKIFPQERARRTSMKFIIIRAPSPYNIILGRPGLKILHAIPSTIHSMIKFPTPKGIATLIARTITIAECRKREEKQMIREETPQEEEGMDVTEQVIVNPSFPDQMVTIGGRLSKGCKEQLKTLLKNNMEVFAWEPADMTGVPRKVIEHALNVNPSLDPVCQKKRTFSPEKSGAVTKEVIEWVKAGIVRPVKYPTTAQSRRHRVISTRAYLDATKCIHKSNAKEDEEKTAFYTEQGTYCYTKMPFGLKNAGATYQKPQDDEGLKTQHELNPKKFFVQVEEGKIPGNMVTRKDFEQILRRRKLIRYHQSPQHWKECKPQREASLLKSRSVLRITLDRPEWKAMSRTIREQNTKRGRKELLPIGKTSSFIVKGQVLADFLSDAPDGEREDEYFQSPEVPPEIDDTEAWTLYTDGAASSKGSGAGLVLTGPSANDDCPVDRGQSRLQAVFSQINGIYEASNDSMIKYLAKAREYISEFQTFSIENIPRGSNQKADVLSKLATVPFHNLTKEILVEVLNERSNRKSRKYRHSKEEGEQLGKAAGQDNGQGNNPLRDGQYHMQIWSPKNHCHGHGVTTDKLPPSNLCKSLTYGSEAVIPAEIGMPSYRTLMIREEFNEEEQRLNLDLLQERREAAAIREARYKSKMEQNYNQEITFRTGFLGHGEFCIPQEGG
ncbi:reverse transcriptase domain-containing protein [Tanacetum coccineum]